MNQNEDGYNLLKYKAWNFKDFSYVYEDTVDPSKVKKIFCLVCKEFQADNKHKLQKFKGKMKDVVHGYIEVLLLINVTLKLI